MSNNNNNSQHDSFLSAYNSGKEIQSSGDKKREAAAQLLEISSRAGDSKSEVLQYHAILKNPKSTKADIKASVQSLKTIAEFLGKVEGITRDAASILAPVKGMPYAHKRLDGEMKEGLIGSKRPQLSAVQDFVNQNCNNSASTPSISVTGRRITPNKPAFRTTRKLPLSTEPPLPKDGKLYGQIEFCELVSRMKKNSQQRGTLLQKIMEKGYVPCSLSKCYKLLSEYEEGNIILSEEWPKRGRPPILSLSEARNVVETFNSEVGPTVNQDIPTILRDAKRQRLLGRGLSDIGVCERVNSETVNNYTGLFANLGLSLSKTSVAKTNTRFTAENSLMGSMALAGLVGSTHFWPVEQEDPKMKVILDKAAPDVREMYDLVSKFYKDSPLQVVKPWNVHNYDDKTIYCIPGAKEGDPPQYVLVTKTSQQQRGKRSVYRKSAAGTSNANGFRSKLFAMVSGAASSAAICLTVFCSEWEMPEDDFIVMEVEGLCIGGAGVNLDNKGKGYILFIRQGEGAEKKRFDWIRDNIVIPQVEKVRSEMDGVDPTSGVVPEEATAIVYTDGYDPNIKSVAESTGLYAEKRIVINKGNPSRTAVEQICDLISSFRIIEQEVQALPSYTALDPDTCPLLKAMLEGFAQLGHRLRFKPSKKSALNKLVVNLPTIYTKAFTKRIIHDGYVEGGYLDRKQLKLPVLNKILATCKKIPTIEQVEACKKAFSIVLKHYLEEGHVSDEVMASHGIPYDVDMEGNTVVRGAGISQENQMRAKNLTHKDCLLKRQQRLQEIAEAKYQQKVRKQAIEKERVETDATSVAKLRSLLGNDDDDLSGCTMDHFQKLTVKPLQIFILARDPNKKLIKDLPKKKGTLQEAQDGQDNLISAAYAVRSNPSRLEGLVFEDIAVETVPITLSGPSVPSVNHVEVLLDESSKHREATCTLLRNESYVKMMCSIFDPLSTQVYAEVNDELVSRAADLTGRLVHRLRRHLLRRLPDASKHNHPIWRFFLKNTPVSAAKMTSFNHVKQNLSSIGETECILSTKMNNFQLCNDNLPPSFQGAYLYYDTKAEKFVRSGKVTGRGFIERDEEHFRNAKSSTTTNDSTFYSKYPSVESTRAGSIARDGLWEDLQMVVAAGFLPTQQNFVTFGKDYNEGGLLFMTKDDKEMIRKVNLRGRSDAEKFGDVVAYTMETAYDLAIGERDNTSDNPGFEAFGFF